MNETPPQISRYDNEIQLIDILRVIWKWKLLIICITLLFSLTTLVYMFARYPAKYVSDCIIELTFPGIEKHANPDGTLFDKNQIIAPNILQKAIASMNIDGNKVLSDGIRGAIKIIPVIPGAIEEERKKAEKAEKPFSFFPNRFDLKLTTACKDDVLSKDQRNRLLLAIVGEYRKGFNRKYGEEPLIAIDFPDNFLEEYDYIEITRLFKMRLSNLIDMLNSKIKQAGFFQSKKVGLTFADIRYNANVLKDIELFRTESIIRDTRLTKNRENLIRKYKNQIKQIELKKIKKESKASVATKLLQQMRQPDRYELKDIKEKTGATVMLDSSFIENLRKNDYYSFLIKTAMNAGIEAGNLGAEKRYFEQEITSLKEKPDLNNKKVKDKGEINNIDVTEKALKKMLNKIVILCKQANDLNKEYLSNIIGEAIQIVRYPATDVIRPQNVTIASVLSGIVALFISVFLVFLIEYIRNTKTEVRT